MNEEPIVLFVKAKFYAESIHRWGKKKLGSYESLFAINREMRIDGYGY